MKLLLSLFLVLTSLNCISQVKNVGFKKNTVYVELLGQGSLWSINYERKFGINDLISHTVSVGFTTRYEGGNLKIDQSFFNSGKGQYYGSPLSYHLLIGKRNSRFDLGLGLTGLYFKGAGWYYDGFCTSYSSDIRSFKSYIVPSISYRFQKKSGGLFIKVSYSPMFSFFKTDNLLNFGRKSNHQILDKSENVIKWPGISLGYTF